MNAEEHKLLGNKAVAAKQWVTAEGHYSNGLLNLGESEKELEVILLSNRSLARLNLGRHREACEDAERVIDLDNKFEKGYIRLAAALEAMKKKRATAEDQEDCPVMQCFKSGLAAIPTSTLIQNAMKISFPWLADDKRGPKTEAVSNSKLKQNKKLSMPTKAQRDACVTVDIRGACGPHELRINGVYSPSEELSGGWPIFKKRTDDETEDGDIDEDDNLILEYNAGLSEWMIKHAACKGTHRSFVFAKCPALSRPEECTGTWQGLEDKRTILQPGLSVVPFDLRKILDHEHFSKVRHTCTTIEVRGATGRKASGINGAYEPIEETCGGWPIYRKVLQQLPSAPAAVGAGASGALSPMSQDGSEDRAILSPSSSADQAVWLEYNPYFKSWQIKPTACLGTNRSWTYVVCNNLLGYRPEQCSSVWEVLDDDDFQAQESISVLTLPQWKEDDAKSLDCWKGKNVLDVRGATGHYAPSINGVYDPAEEFTGGYRKRTDSVCVIEYNRRRSIWQMRSAGGAYAYIHDPQRSPPERVAGSWHVIINGVWEVHTGLSVMAMDDRKALDMKLYGDKLAEAVPLDVRGAQGVNSFKINGVYEPTQEVAGGWPVYQRKGSFDYWLEYNADRANWQIKSAANRGMDSAFAYVDSNPPTRPELSREPWWVYTGNKSGSASNGWEQQRSVTVLTVADRHIEDMELFEQRRGECVPVDIRGALGPRSGGLNGVFDPTDEMHGGWPVYRKRDDPDWWLEFDACPQKWMVRPTPCRGTTRGRAYILSEPHLRPEQAKGMWRMSDGKGGWAIEASIFVRKEVEAIVEDRIKFDARRCTAVTIDLRGVTRPMSYINGVYEPTNEACFGWPVYKKKSSENQWLEYHLPSKEWQVKPTSCKGTKKNWAYISSDPTHPELCTGSSWMVFLDGKHTKQENVTVVALDQRIQEDRGLAEMRRPACVAVEIRGAAGVHMDSVNGVYEPSMIKSCGGWPSYMRQTNHCKALLEFNAYAMSWTITSLVFSPKAPPAVVNAADNAGAEGKEEESKGSATATSTVVPSSFASASPSALPPAPPSPVLVAFVEMVKAGRPDQCKDNPNPWKVLGSERFEVQEGVRVMTLAQSQRELREEAARLQGTQGQDTLTGDVKKGKDGTSLSEGHDAKATADVNGSAASSVNTTQKSSKKKNKKSQAAANKSLASTSTDAASPAPVTPATLPPGPAPLPASIPSSTPTATPTPAPTPVPTPASAPTPSVPIALAKAQAPQGKGKEVTASSKSAAINTINGTSDHNKTESVEKHSSTLGPNVWASGSPSLKQYVEKLSSGNQTTGGMTGDSQSPQMEGSGTADEWMEVGMKKAKGAKTLNPAATPSAPAIPSAAVPMKDPAKTVKATPTTNIVPAAQLKPPSLTVPSDFINSLAAPRTMVGALSGAMTSSSSQSVPLDPLLFPPGVVGSTTAVATPTGQATGSEWLNAVNKKAKGAAKPAGAGTATPLAPISIGTDSNASRGQKVDDPTSAMEFPAMVSQADQKLSSAVPEKASSKSKKGKRKDVAQTHEPKEIAAGEEIAAAVANVVPPVAQSPKRGREKVVSVTSSETSHSPKSKSKVGASALAAADTSAAPVSPKVSRKSQHGVGGNGVHTALDDGSNVAARPPDLAIPLPSTSSVASAIPVPPLTPSLSSVSADDDAHSSFSFTQTVVGESLSLNAKAAPFHSSRVPVRPVGDANAVAVAMGVGVDMGIHMGLVEAPVRGEMGVAAADDFDYVMRDFNFDQFNRGGPGYDMDFDHYSRFDGVSTNGLYSTGAGAGTGTGGSSVSHSEAHSREEDDDLFAALSSIHGAQSGDDVFASTFYTPDVYSLALPSIPSMSSLPSLSDFSDEFSGDMMGSLGGPDFNGINGLNGVNQMTMGSALAMGGSRGMGVMGSRGPSMSSPGPSYASVSDPVSAKDFEMLTSSTDHLQMPSMSMSIGPSHSQSQSPLLTSLAAASVSAPASSSPFMNIPPLGMDEPALEPTGSSLDPKIQLPSMDPLPAPAYFGSGAIQEIPMANDLGDYGGMSAPFTVSGGGTAASGCFVDGSIAPMLLKASHVRDLVAAAPADPMWISGDESGGGGGGGGDRDKMQMFELGAGRKGSVGATTTLRETRFHNAQVVLRVDTAKPTASNTGTGQHTAGLLKLDGNQEILRELQVLITLGHHPRFVPLVGYCLNPLVVMFPLMREGSLRMWLCNDSQRRRLTWRARLRIVCCVAEAVSYLHSSFDSIDKQRMAHRNIHLNNIFVTSIPSGSDVDGEYNGVLGDLRMAVDVDDLAVANDKKLDAKAFANISPLAVDLFQLGVVLGQLFTGSAVIDSRLKAEYHRRLNATTAGATKDRDRDRGGGGGGKKRDRPLSPLGSTNEAPLGRLLERLAEPDVWPPHAAIKVAEGVERCTSAASEGGFNDVGELRSLLESLGGSFS